jgi:hypothetical protein
MGVRVVECEIEPGHAAFATEQERKVLARQRARAPDVAPPRITIEWEGNEPCFVPQHVDEAIGWQVLMDAFATTNRAFVEGLLKQLLAVTENNSEKELNFLVSIVTGLKPRDEAEALLATNIAVGHAWTMRWAFRLNYTSGAIQDEMLVGMFAKLARTLTAQFEALKRYRTGGEQKIVVQHTQNVSVEGQAIVGNVTHMKGKAEESPAAPAAAPLALPNAAQQPPPIMDVPAREAVPVPARGRRKASQ